MIKTWPLAFLLATFGICRDSAVRIASREGFDPPLIGMRERLLVEDLRDGTVDGMVDNDTFRPMGRLAVDPPAFSGTLTFSAARLVTQIPDATWEGEGFTWFPRFSLGMISHGNVLIPVQRGLIRCGEQNESVWNIIVGAGRIWTEVSDDGWARASFPFTLTTNGVGQARNGLATFVWQGSELSQVFIQSSQETTPADDYIPGDLYAMVPVDFEPVTWPDADQIIVAYTSECAARLPVRPWSELDDADALKAMFTQGLSDTDQSAGAVVVDGVIYLQPCATRTGPYPFPHQMRHGVFSVTKSLCGALSMFYLAQRYTEDVFEARIGDYVPELADHPGWRGVTFSHALNMVTGTRGSEEGMDIYPFIVARNAQQKIHAVAALPNAPPAPGQVFNYASTNFFVLSYAMNEYVKRREGADANYWDQVVEDVLRPIGAHTLVVSRTIEYDGAPGIPILGWGGYPTVDEAAKIACLLHQEGLFEGQQLLHGDLVRQALGRQPWSYFVDFYRHSFWLDEEVFVGCPLRVPHMSGHGGNMVGICPSGIVFIRFGDANQYEIAPLVRTCESIRASCRP